MSVLTVYDFRMELIQINCRKKLFSERGLHRPGTGVNYDIFFCFVERGGSVGALPENILKVFCDELTFPKIHKS